MIFPQLILKVERWKFNKDYGVYVSNLGHFRDRHKRLLPVKINQKGYCGIETERGLVFAHRLVMFTWRPIPNAEALTVDHLDHNKRNNAVSNLEWVTKEENLRRAQRDLVEMGPKAFSPLEIFARTHTFINKTTGQHFADAYEAVKYLLENNHHLVNEKAINNGAINLVKKVNKNEFYYKYQWEAIPHTN